MDNVKVDLFVVVVVVWPSVMTLGMIYVIARGMY
jgi:hypothetical protein